MRKMMVVIAAAGATYGAARWWRENRRTGTAFVNRVVDPWLTEHGVIGRSHGALGLIEHVGRTSGIARRTPVHPMPTGDGFRIVLPVGERSEWARNVLVAGRCRLVLGDEVLDLDDPVLERPREVAELPRVLAGLFEWLGFRYLRLRSAQANANANARDSEVEPGHLAA